MRRDRRAGIDLQSRLHVAVFVPLLPRRQELLLPRPDRRPGAALGLLPRLPIRLVGLPGRWSQWTQSQLKSAAAL